MFTGIIEATARILEKSPRGLTIERPKTFTDLKLGSSISVSGVCLSVVEMDRTSMRFDVVSETLKKTILGSLKKGDRVNLERAMQLMERFEGHVVQGHVEGIGKVESGKWKVESGLSLSLPSGLLKFVLPQGSITIDGVSLTVASVKDGAVTIALIPHTLKNTTLGALKKGDRVNIETDMMVRAIARLYPAKP